MPRLLSEIVHGGRIDAGVDRSAHQDHGCRRVGILVRFHQRDRGQHRHRGLTHRDHMGVAAERMQDRDHVFDVVVEIEPAFRSRHHARVRPIGDVDIVIGQKGFDRAAQQRRKMARHRRDDQKLRLRPLRRMLQRRARNAGRGRTAAPRPCVMLTGTRSPPTSVEEIAPFRLAVTAGRTFEQFAGRGDGLAVGRERQRIDRVLEEQPRRVGHGARRIERRVAHLVEPVERRRQECAAFAAWNGRRAAKLTDRH